MQIGQMLGRFALAAATVLLAATAGLGQATDQSVPRPIVLLAAIEGPIGPATVRHVEKVIEAAAARGAEALVLRIDTPGGLADAMRDIISAILTSPVPVIGWVAPPGAHAASAGTYILYATHVAAMAPGTNLGAATPVQIGGLPGMPEPGREPPGTDKPEAKPEGRSDAETGEEAGSRARPLSGGEAMTHKVTNDAVAFIRSLAEMHGRNADWAEEAVREAASLSAQEALDQRVIDFLAEDAAAVLAAADGRAVNAGGRERILSIKGAQTEEFAPDAVTRLLAVLSNPNLALVLMMIGVYGIIFEFWNPGAVAPGVVGAISLTLGLYSLNQLPLDYAGLALIGLGIAFMVAEAFSPSFGVLGFGGLIAFVIGAAMLVDTDEPAYQLSWWLIGTMAALSAAILVVLLGFTLRAYRRPAVSGASQLIGAEAQVLDWSGTSGYVWADGERWAASGAAGLAIGAKALIRDIDGLTLIVDPGADDEDSDLRQETEERA